MGKRVENPTCNHCGTTLTEQNWYPSHRNPKLRLCPSGKFYALRLYICKPCWRLESKKKALARKERLNASDPLHEQTRYGGLRLLWRGTYLRRNIGKEGREIAEKAERIGVERVLPGEGFEDILWLHNHHAAFDILARRGAQSYMIDVTTAPYKRFNQLNSGNKAAIEWLLRNLKAQLLVLFISPDLSRYVLKPSGVGNVGLTRSDVDQATRL